VLASVETLRGRDTPLFFKSASTRSMGVDAPLPTVGVDFGAAFLVLVLGVEVGWAGTLPGHLKFPR
jgi:hypothetical protein